MFKFECTTDNDVYVVIIGSARPFMYPDKIIILLHQNGNFLHVIYQAMKVLYSHLPILIFQISE